MYTIRYVISQLMNMPNHFEKSQVLLKLYVIMLCAVRDITMSSYVLIWIAARQRICLCRQVAPRITAFPFNSSPFRSFKMPHSFLITGLVVSTVIVLNMSVTEGLPLLLGMTGCGRILICLY